MDGILPPGIMSRQLQQILEDIERLRLQDREKLLELLEQKAWTRLSERAFSEDWSSDEDEVYDTLPTR